MTASPPPLSEALFVYVTTPTPELAKVIAKAIVAQQLAACANIIPSMTSIYRWKGAVEEALETVLIFKTQAALFDKLAKAVKALHPYECACIIGLPLVAGTSDYLSWIRAETDVDRVMD
ncbi:MAG TPA: divalent-cation tolerance protein CutA [Rhodospirillaceae bacterium]|nr:divalent-cation tolerance protein CutA [Rhodospirillaceae bacterium]